MRNYGKIFFVALVFFFFVSGVANAGTWIRSVTVEKIKQNAATPMIIVKDGQDRLTGRAIYGNGSLDTKKMLLAIAMLAYSTQDTVDVYYTDDGVTIIMVSQ